MTDWRQLQGNQRGKKEKQRVRRSTRVFSDEVLDQIRTWIGQGWSKRQIAAELDVPRGALARACRANGISFAGGVVFTGEILAQIPVWVKEGKTKEEIAEQIGTTRESLIATCSIHRISLVQDRDDLSFMSYLSDLAQQRLRDKARELDWSVMRLTTNILELVAVDDMFDAVLDLERRNKAVVEPGPEPERDGDDSEDLL